MTSSWDGAHKIREHLNYAWTCCSVLQLQSLGQRLQLFLPALQHNIVYASQLLSVHAQADVAGCATRDYSVKLHLHRSA